MKVIAVDDEELNAILGTTLSSGEEDKEIRFFEECVKRLKKRYLDRKISEISTLISKEKDGENKKALLVELNEMILQSKKV